MHFLSLSLSRSRPCPSCCWKELEKVLLHYIVGLELIQIRLIAALHYRLVFELVTNYAVSKTQGTDSLLVLEYESNHRYRFEPPGKGS